MEYLSDSHFKVVAACLDSLITIVSKDSQLVLYKLEEIIPKVGGPLLPVTKNSN